MSNESSYREIEMRIAGALREILDEYSAMVIGLFLFLHTSVGISSNMPNAEKF